MTLFHIQRVLGVRLDAYNVFYKEPLAFRLANENLVKYVSKDYK